MSERRAFSRTEYPIEAVLQYAGDSFPSKIINLSLRGTLVSTAASPMKGQRVTVTFTNPAAYQPVTVTCRGRVVRSERRGIAVEFDDATSPDTLEQLRDFIVAYNDDPDTVLDEFGRISLQEDKNL